ncbi:hypothetical protein D1872_89990 [compost metagenome]
MATVRGTVTEVRKPSSSSSGSSTPVVRGTVTSVSRGSSSGSSTPVVRGTVTSSSGGSSSSGNTSRGTVGGTGVSYTAPSYSSGGGSSSSAPFNAAAANDIVYWKQKYDEAVNAGKKSSLDWIQKQAQKSYAQLDQNTANTLRGMNAAQAAAWYRAARDSENNNNAAMAAPQYAQQQAAAAPVVAEQQQMPSEYEQMLAMLQQQMAGYDQQMLAYQQQAADFQRQQQMLAQQQLQSLMGQYQNMQDADLAAIDAQFNEAKGNLEDDSFQQYLQARQAMANRGLAGSGLASDQDTRLLMANNRNLTSLQNNLNNQRNQIKLRYGAQMDDVRNQLGAISSIPYLSGVGEDPRTASSGISGNNALLDNIIYSGGASGNGVSKYMRSALASGGGSPSGVKGPDDTTLNMAFDLFKEVLPYTRATVKDQMQYAIDVDEQRRKWTDTFGYDPQTGNPTLDRLKYMLDVDKASDASAQAWTKIYGQDPNGNLTFDARKWMAEFDLDKWYKQQNVDQGWQDVNIRQFKAEQDVAQGWQSVQIQQQNANTRLAELEQKKYEFTTSQQRKDFEAQVGSVKTLMNSAYSAMNDAQKRMAASLSKGGQVDPNDFETYQRAKKQYDIAYAALDGLSETGINMGAGLVQQPLQSPSFTPGNLNSEQSRLFDPFYLSNLSGRTGTSPNSSAPSSAKSSGIGSLSKKYESNGNPGTIANNKGDIGGASYGSYQIATNTGTMNSFLKFVQKTDPKTYKALSGKKPGSSAFNSAWKSLAAKDPKGFEELQHKFVEGTHYQPAVASVLKATGLDVRSRSKAVQDALWSTAVQHGPGGAERIFKNAKINPVLSDDEIIKRIYKERAANGGMKYFPSSSPAIRASVVKRFAKEQRDALAMLKA